jgi:hypothetical protein
VKHGKKEAPLLVCVLQGGPFYTIDVDGKNIPFEMHPYCGPMPIDKNGSGITLGPRHKFWKAVTWWDREGRKVDADGKAIWYEPPSILEDSVHLGGRHYMAKLKPGKIYKEDL